MSARQVYLMVQRMETPHLIMHFLGHFCPILAGFFVGQFYALKEFQQFHVLSFHLFNSFIMCTNLHAVRQQSPLHPFLLFAPSSSVLQCVAVETLPHWSRTAVVVPYDQAAPLPATKRELPYPLQEHNDLVQTTAACLVLHVTAMPLLSPQRTPHGSVPLQSNSPVSFLLCESSCSCSLTFCLIVPDDVLAV